jgi:hypothetical protein
MRVALVLIGAALLPFGAYVAFHIWRPIRRMPDEDLEACLVRLFIWPPLGLFIPVALIAVGLIGEGGTWWAALLAVAVEAILVAIARRQKARRGPAE